MARRGLIKGLVLLLCILSISWFALDYFIPAPPSRITIATGAKGTGLDYFGERYRDRLARLGLDVNLRPTAGTTENCKLLHDPNSGVDVSFVTAGFCDNDQMSELLSLGAIFDVPTWIFYSSPEPLVSLSQLKGKRIAAGREGSGVRDIADRILGKAKINSKTATLLPLAGNAAVAALNDGKADAVMITSIPRAEAIQTLLTDPRFRLMDFSTAEAFTRVFPEFVRLVWPKGIVEIDPPNPPNDMTLLGVTLKVIIRSDVHPVIVQILARTLQEEHRRPGTFSTCWRISKEHRSGISLSQIAIDYYKNGPSFLQEYLPFWMTIYARRAIAFLVAMLAIALPVFSFAPKLYGWFVQERLRTLYGRIRLVENALEGEVTVLKAEALQKELADIDRATNDVPMRNSDFYLIMRYHIDQMRSRLVEASQGIMTGGDRA